MKTLIKCSRYSARILATTFVICALALMLGSLALAQGKGGGGGGGGGKPAVPTGLTANSSAIREITLNWNAVSGATSYKVYRGVLGDRKLPLVATRTDTNYVDTGLTGGATYQYAVTAVNSAGASSPAYVNGYALTGLPPGADPAVAFHSQGIRVMDADGGNVTRLTTTGGWSTWSPDGMQIAYLNGSTLCVMNRDGTGTVQIADNVINSDYRPAWSPSPTPDGRYKIAYTDAMGDIWVVNPDGTGNRQLTYTTNDLDTGRFEGSCSWSPDATRLVVEVWTDLSAEPWNIDRLEVLDLAYDGIGISEVGRTTVLEDLTGNWLIYSVDWCRTGNPGLGRPDRVVFDALNLDTFDSEIYTMDLADPYSLALLLPGYAANQWVPTWSPDDSLIMFESYSYLYTVGSNGGTPLQIGPGYSPTWRRF